MDDADLAALVGDLRTEGGDLTVVEVKRAARGYPDTVAPSLSGFGNTPGGGVILFGLDESSAFSSVGVYDIAKCKKAVAAAARNAVEPRLVVDVQDFTFEGSPIVAATVNELPPSHKPCRVRSSGRAYLRSYDGDYPLSELEIQAFIANRATPRFDEHVVEAASRDDLDADLTDRYCAQASQSSRALGRFGTEELLFRTGVLVGEDRRPSVAGLLSLGTYPQQFFPNLVIQASVDPGSRDPAGTRVADTQRFDGPLPWMLDDALRWVARNSRARVRFGADGVGRDELEYPPEAVRELLSNALVHRDYGPYALSEAITLRLQSDKLVLSNPGGLHGLTVERLGLTGVTSARNGYLVRICQDVRIDGGGRVVEALATGIPTVLDSVSRAGMVPPRFFDQGIRFAVLMPNHALLARDDLDWLAGVSRRARLSDIQRHVLVRMRHGDEFTNSSLREAFPMDSRDATKVLSGLVDAGFAEPRGERGGRVYRIVSSLGGGPAIGGGRVGGAGRGVEQEAPRRPATVHEESIVAALAHGAATRRELGERTGLTARQLQYSLARMRETGVLRMVGGPGRISLYRLSGADDDPAPRS